jgi:hypothetical protein
MIKQRRRLVTMMELIDQIPTPSYSSWRGRGRPQTYSDRLFLKALVVMIVRRLPSVHELLSVLEQPTQEMRQLKQHLHQQGQFPSRRTWERRLNQLPCTLPEQIACLGQHLLTILQPWTQRGRAVAIDSTLLRARGGVWHQKDRNKGIIPHTSIDTQAHWGKSDWHKWIYGWKLHVVLTVADVWIPLVADLTPANAYDGELGQCLLEALPDQVRVVLGDRHYNTPAIRELCQDAEKTLIASRYGAYPHTDDGVEVRRIFHRLRSTSIENFNGQFKAIFDLRGQVPTKGETNTRRYILGAVLVYQLSLWYRAENNMDLRVGLKHFLKAA